MSFITSLGDVLGGTLAAVIVQTVVNALNAPNLDRGLQFLADGPTGFFHALEGTAPGLNSDRTDLEIAIELIGRSKHRRVTALSFSYQAQDRKGEIKWTFCSDGFADLTQADFARCARKIDALKLNYSAFDEGVR
jgi:hypothetical protein